VKNVKFHPDGLEKRGKKKPSNAEIAPSAQVRKVVQKLRKLGTAVVNG